ncbi:MAG: PEP-utilizing enzyme [bacterium]
MLSLLHSFYADNGPVERVYARLGISFNFQDFFVVQQGELFIDRKKELASFFPLTSVSLRKAGAKTFLKHLWITLNNGVRLTFFFKTRPLDELTYELLTAVTKSADGEDFSGCLRQFLLLYETIIEVNIQTDRIVKKSLALLGKDALSHIGKPILPSLPNLESLGMHTWLGNGIDIADEHPFVHSNSAEVPVAKENEKPCTMPHHKAAITAAQRALGVREFGRWVTVRWVTILRGKLFAIADRLQLSSPQLLYFATLEEILAERVHEEVCKERKVTYEQHFQSRKSQSPSASSTKEKISLKNVSPGNARGVLCSLDQLEKFSKQRDCILCTDQLTPDLVTVFPLIKGILSLHGGILSHVAIVAREVGIPVICGVTPSQLGLTLGDEVVLDSSKTNSIITKGRE